MKFERPFAPQARHCSASNSATRSFGRCPTFSFRPCKKKNDAFEVDNGGGSVLWETRRQKLKVQSDMPWMTQANIYCRRAQTLPPMMPRHWAIRSSKQVWQGHSRMERPTKRRRGHSFVRNLPSAAPHRFGKAIPDPRRRRIINAGACSLESASSIAQVWQGHSRTAPPAIHKCWHMFAPVVALSCTRKFPA